MWHLAIVTVAVLLAGAQPAHAGFVVAFVASVFSAIGAGAALALALAQVTVGLLFNLASTALAKALQKTPQISVKFDVEFGDNTPLGFVVGDYATGGKRRYIGSWGPSTRYITEVIEVSCLPQAALAAMWVNDELAEIDWENTQYHMPNRSVIDWLSGEEPDGTLLGHPIMNESLGGGDNVWVRWIDGTQTAADATLVALFGADPDYPWAADMIGTGKSYVIVTTRYNSDYMASYPTFLWQPAPLPVYDPRLDDTAGGEGDHRWGDRATYEASNNAAVIAYNIGRGIYLGDEWIFGGRNLPAWRLPLAEWVAAMNECDAAVALHGGGTEPAYRAGAAISVDMEPLGVMEEIGRAANMRFAEVGGMIKPIIGLPGSATMSITDDDILITEGQSMTPFYPLGQTFNALSATYPEPGEKWASKDSPEFVDVDAVAADGGRYLPASVSYGAAPYARQVQRLQRAQMLDYRRMRQHQFALPPAAMALEPLVDTLSWTSARNGYDAKLFVIERIGKSPGMNVQVHLREVDPGDYDWDTEFEMPVSIVAPVNPTPAPQTIDGFAVTAVSITDGSATARRPALKVVCNPAEVGVTSIRIQVRKDGATDPEQDFTAPFGAPHEWIGQNVLPATDYEVRAQLVSDLTPASEWSDWEPVTTLNVLIDAPDIQIGAISRVVYAHGAGPTVEVGTPEYRTVKGDDDIIFAARLSPYRNPLKLDITVWFGRVSGSGMAGLTVTPEVTVADDSSDWQFLSVDPGDVDFYTDQGYATPFVTSTFIVGTWFESQEQDIRKIRLRFDAISADVYIVRWAVLITQINR